MIGHCATSWKVAGLIPNGVTGIFHLCNPSGRTMALGSTQPLTAMVPGISPGAGKGSQCIGLITLQPSCANCLEIWEPKPPGTLQACQACNGIAFYLKKSTFVHSFLEHNTHQTKFQEPCCSSRCRRWQETLPINKDKCYNTAQYQYLPSTVSQAPTCSRTYAKWVAELHPVICQPSLLHPQSSCLADQAWTLLASPHGPPCLPELQTLHPKRVAGGRYRIKLISSQHGSVSTYWFVWETQSWKMDCNVNVHN